METIEAQLFWISMMQGKTAQEYVEAGLKVIRNFQDEQ